jgi:uncharacterized RDD family membrane protein YckC
VQSADQTSLGLPADGVGSTASVGQRAVGFAIDAVLSALVASIFTAPHLPRNTSLIVLGVEYVLFTAIFGQTPGMRVVGIRLARLNAPPPDGPAGQPTGTSTAIIGVPRAVVRTVLLLLLIPAVIWNSDSRGLHDRAAGVVVVRSRP